RLMAGKKERGGSGRRNRRAGLGQIILGGRNGLLLSLPTDFRPWAVEKMDVWLGEVTAIVSQKAARLGQRGRRQDASMFGRRLEAADIGHRHIPLQAPAEQTSRGAGSACAVSAITRR